MAASEFAFLRGAPAIMAADLAASPNTGLTVQLCGDAHLSNFGMFASPERSLLFDLNDFDETLPGPFEWDLKRLAASVAVAARANGCTDAQAHDAAHAAGGGYREEIRRLATMDELSVWYERIDTASLVAAAKAPKRKKDVEQAVASARAHTNLQALAKLTEPGPDGVPRIRQDPPLLEPIPAKDLADVSAAFDAYRSTLPEERRVLLDRHTMVEAARKVVGVGSVGTRCYIVLLLGHTTGAPLFLQVKEAERSVLEPHLRKSVYQNQGHRVVFGQRLLQATSDIFLGWAAGPEHRDYYVRQLRDMKGTVDIEDMSHSVLLDYARLCGYALARAHARSGDRVAVAAYLGTGDAFEQALADFAIAYADQTKVDHRALLDAIRDGRIKDR
jgi:uncharacterized protein (DUF2252 family)